MRGFWTRRRVQNDDARTNTGVLPLRLSLDKFGVAQGQDEAVEVLNDAAGG
jgi:hypothetical protein